MLDGCTKLICSIVKQNKTKDYKDHKKIKYTIKDCEGKVIWNTGDRMDISQVLCKKTKQYINACKDTDFASDNQMVWVLAVKDGDFFYKNVAVCKCFQYAMNEINVHIRQLVYNVRDQLNKTKTYQSLWGDNESEIEFLEVNIDEYINKCEKEQPDLQKSDPYIYSLISSKAPSITESSENISRKIRASFVEGKIASDYDLKISGIWNPSGVGIDGDIYEYYKSKSGPHVS